MSANSAYGALVTTVASPAVRTDGPYSIGYEFTVGTTPYTINALGVYDMTSNDGGAGGGLEAAHAVEIWNSSGGSVAIATVTAGTAGAATNYYRYAMLSTPVTLTAGQSYYISTYIGGGGANDYFYDSSSTNDASANADITLDNSYYASPGGSLAAPNFPNQGRRRRRRPLVRRQRHVHRHHGHLERRHLRLVERQRQLGGQCRAHGQQHVGLRRHDQSRRDQRPYRQHAVRRHHLRQYGRQLHPFGQRDQPHQRRGQQQHGNPDDRRQPGPRWRRPHLQHGRRQYARLGKHFAGQRHRQWPVQDWHRHVDPQRPNSYAGDTTILAGTLQLGNANALLNSTVNVGVTNGLAFALGTTATTIGGLSGSGNFVLQDSGSNPVTLTVGSNNVSTNYAGVISGGGNLVKTGTGTPGSPTVDRSRLTGGTTVQAGTLRPSNNYVAESFSSVNVYPVPPWIRGAAISRQHPLRLGTVSNGYTNAVTLTVGGTGGTSEFDGTISNGGGSVALTKSGTGA